jgi:hypothetical protein
VGRHIATHNRTRPDDCTLADSDVGQDDTMRPNKDVLFNHNFSVVDSSSGSRIKVGDYRCSEADRAVISDRYVCRMYFIDVNKLANPNVFSNRNSAQPLEPRTQTESSRCQKSYPTCKPTEQKWQNQRLLPLMLELENAGTLFHFLLTAPQIAFAQHFHEQPPPLKTLAYPTS